MKVSTSFCLGLSFWLGVSVGSTATIFDDFDDGEDASPAWTLVDASLFAGGPAGERSFGPGDNQYRLLGAALASARLDLVLQDGMVRVDLMEWNPSVSGGASVGILARFNPETLSGYFMSIDFDGSPSVNLVRLDGGVPGDSAGGLTKIYDQAKTYTLEVRAQGTTITGRVYENDNGTATLFDEVVLTDTTYGAGFTGLLSAQDSFPTSVVPGDATFDNFFATDGVIAQPELVDATLIDGSVGFGVTSEPGRTYTVEYRNGVDEAVWNVLTEFGPKPLAGINVVVDPAGLPGRIYRASTPED